MENDVHRSVDVDVAGHVVSNELERAAAQVLKVAEIARQQVVDADDRVTAIEQRFAEMRSQESGGAGDDDSQYAIPRWNRPRKSVSHMIFRSRVTDQFSM